MSRQIFATMLVGFAALTSGAWDGVDAAEIDGAPKKIKVVTVTENGEFIRAKVRIKAYPEPEKDAYVLQNGKGFTVISIDKCDDFVSISVVPQTIGIIRKTDGTVPDWLPCKEPEVVFNDFAVVSFTASISSPELKKAEFWNKALGDVAVEMKPQLPQDLADAFANQEYGKISIIATELEKPLRAAGKLDEANFLYSIAVDAGARGVLASSGDAPNIATADVLEYSSDNNRFELKADVKSLVEDYQVREFGYKENSGKLGKFTWQTMKSLSGGDTVHAPAYQIDLNAAANFNGDLLQELRTQQF